MNYDELVALRKASINEFEWSTLTAAVREIRSPARFLMELLFSRHQTVSTSKIEIGTILQGREIAPFVKRGGEALLVDEHAKQFAEIEAPNIRIKLPFTANRLLFERQPGTPILIPEGGSQLSAIEQRISLDLQIMDERIVNSTELLCSQLIAGQIAYTQSPNASFQLTVPRPATHVTISPILWDNADPQLPNIEFDAHTAKRILNDDPGMSPDVCLLGRVAAQNFINVNKRQNNVLDKRRMDDGNMTLQSRFTDAGAIFLGRMHGIDYWEYSRTLNVNGVVTDLIRPNYAEYISLSGDTDRVLYYGAIDDITALQNGVHVAERFSKSWVKEDPSQITYLTQSCPLPWARRPNTWVSMQVTT